MPAQRLDDLDEQYVNVNLDDDDFSRAEHAHQGLSFCSYGFLLCCFRGYFLTVGYFIS